MSNYAVLSLERHKNQENNNNNNNTDYIYIVILAGTKTFIRIYRSPPLPITFFFKYLLKRLSRNRKTREITRYK